MTKTVSRRKTIQGHEGLYAVDRCGFVWNISGDDGRFHDKNWAPAPPKKMRMVPDKDGYFSVFLCGNGKVARHRVHRLVAKAFLPNPDNKPVVNHKDGNRQNNHVNNLEWATVAENNRHAYNELHRRLSGCCANHSHPVVCVETGVRYPMIKDAERALGVCESSIRQCLRGTRHTAGGCTGGRDSYGRR